MKLVMRCRGFTLMGELQIMGMLCRWMARNYPLLWWPRLKPRKRSKPWPPKTKQKANLADSFSRLSKTRRKRSIPNEWITSDALQTFKVVENSAPLYSGATSVPLNTNDALALIGGTNGIAGVYSLSQKKVVYELDVGAGAITDATWVGGRAVFATVTGHVKIFEDRSEVASFKGHNGEVTALAVHPSNEILASVGVDRSYIFYDLSTLSQAMQVYSNSSKILKFYTSNISLTAFRFHKR